MRNGKYKTEIEGNSQGASKQEGWGDRGLG